MHCCLYLVTEKVPDEGDIERLMEPYREDGNGPTDDWKWDWYQIGGRWTGVLSGYDPETDSANMEQCILCRGSGMRNDDIGLAARAKDPTYTCNGCMGEGKSLKWPTEWKDPQPTIKVKDAFEKVVQDEYPQRPYAFLFEHTYGDKWREQNYLDASGDEWKEKAEKIWRSLNPEHYITVIDYHC